MYVLEREPLEVRSSHWGLLVTPRSMLICIMEVRFRTLRLGENVSCVRKTHEVPIHFGLDPIQEKQLYE